MKGLNNNLTGGHAKLLPLVILVTVLVFSLFSWHQMINSDSVNGFDAMKGYGWTGRFNTLLYFDPGTHRLQERFLTWWSPGQYLAPLFLMDLFHLNIGASVTLVNLLGSLLGVTGYWLLFRQYRFDKLVTAISVVLILFSSTVLARYYLYNGGESLNLMVFPWIIVCRRLLLHRVWRWVFPALVLLLSFVSKLQMLIIVPPLLFLLLATQVEGPDPIFERKQFFERKNLGKIVGVFIPFFISVGLAILFIYFYFLDRGETPASMLKGLSLNPKNFLFPLSSPVTSIYLFDSITAYLNTRPLLQDVYLLAISLVLIIVLWYAVRRYFALDPVKRKYLVIAGGLYLFSVVVFSFLYSAGSSVDFNTRHLKLTSFLLYPIVIEQALQRLNRKLVFGSVLLFCLYAVGNHVRLAKKWTAHSTVTPSGFRLTRQDMPLAEKEKLDSMIKSKTVVVSPYSTGFAIDNPLILAIPGGKDERDALTGSHYPVIWLDSAR